MTLIELAEILDTELFIQFTPYDNRWEAGLNDITIASSIKDSYSFDDETVEENPIRYGKDPINALADLALSLKGKYIKKRFGNKPFKVPKTLTFRPRHLESRLILTDNKSGYSSAGTIKRSEPGQLIETNKEDLQ